MTKLQSLEQLLDVAEEVFRRKGYAGTSLQEIAAALGMTRPALYYHVTSKTGLRLLVVERRTIRLTEEIAQLVATDAPPADRLAAALRAYLREIEEFSSRLSDWYMDDVFTDDNMKLSLRIEATTARQRSILRRVVVEGITSGDFDPGCDPTVVVHAMLGMCNWVPHWYREGGRLSVEDVGDSFIRLVLQGLLMGARPAHVPALMHAANIASAK